MAKKDRELALLTMAGADMKLSGDERRSEELVWAAEDQMRFGIELMDSKEITREQLEAAMWASAVNDDSIGKTLVLQGVIRQERLMTLMEKFDYAQISTAMQYNVPIDDVSILHRERVALFGMSSKTIYLACLGNQRVVRHHFEALFPEHNLEFLGIRPQQIEIFLSKTDRLPKNPEQRSGSADGRVEIQRFVPRETDDADILNLIVNLAGIRGGSDIHIEPKAKSYSILLRINRIRRIIHEGPLGQYNTLRAQVKERAKMDQMEHRRPQDGAYSQEILGRMFDLRVASFPLDGGYEKIVIRLLDPDKASKHLTDLGIRDVTQWRAACGHPHGLVFVAGKTNSGKSTTLISSLREQDRIGKSIYTIEDPIEHRVEFITQMAVNRAESVQLDFKAGVRAMMRGDPEIILVGEIRDEETAAVAVSAAESGHLVFSTLHAGTVRESISRLRGMGITDEMLRPMVRGILAQRLMRTICNHCRNKDGTGCPMCLHTGYGGMTVISEMGFFPSEGHFNRMLKGEVFWDSMLRDALEKLDRGITDEKEVYRVFQSEIEYLNEDYAGIADMAKRVLSVVRNEAPSRVERDSGIGMSAEDFKALEDAEMMQAELRKFSITGTVPTSMNPEVLLADPNRYGD
ncbi:GspE/PulE family protein [Sphingomonas sp. 3-13AW]|uniref:GspE/PulE family protein n=1 Tax=Sphingomonas sp. 3-13AW TaxID=3050450 RepID=UPI003BB4A16A